VSTQALLEVEDYSAHFVGGDDVVRAVDGISFTLEQGHALGIVGESGAGKTVLAHSIMGLLPSRDDVQHGSIRLDGRELTGLSVRAMRSVWGAQMAMVFQDPMTSLNPVMRIGHQITEPLHEHTDMSRGEANTSALALLRSVGIAEPERRMHEYPHQLSGGMCQRVMIALALAAGPKLLLADEPTTALDVTVQAQILQLLRTQQRERYMAMILVTHDLRLVATAADSVLVMYAGRIVERAPTAALFARMHMPYTEALLRSIPSLSQPSHTRLAVIPGRPPDLGVIAAGCRFSPRCPYARERCRVEEPPLQPAETPDHEFACWYPVNLNDRRG
jgi:oligopeptide/dipeptide ABC transporter ATP-binding protein